MNIFVAGARSVRKLDDAVNLRLFSIYEKGYSVMVGDACGVDSSVQSFFANLAYKNVVVYACNGVARNNIGHWAVRNVQVSSSFTGFDFYKQKDIVMANEADCGMMIWNGESRGTLHNIINLLVQNKPILVYFTPRKALINVNSFDKMETLLAYCPDSTKRVVDRMKVTKCEQLTLF